ncbi:recombinase family protein [Flavobacterium sp. ZS1P70]|jgi:DNA invertase Pin-like site-specific DNA recombinase|uniref:Recombinase family protein n=1 Tax=Flavobacterium zhoui TaxID=3230414 RepID=A0ABW6I4P0_9FLAO
MEKAVIYVRVSTLDQNTDRQIFDLTNYSKQLNLKIDKVFSDTISGFKKGFDDREQFNLMLEYINKNQIKNILVSELSRISRQYIHTVNFIHNCSEKLINIHIQKENLSTLNKDGTTNGMVQMMVGLLSSISSQESATLSYRIKSGKRSEALKGNSYHGQLYGYDKIDGRPVINQEEAIFVRKMYEMLLQGFGCRKIATYLTEAKAGQKVWSSATVHSIVTNPFFKGKRRFKDIIIDVDAIVSEQVFNEAQTFIKSRFRFVSDSKHTNPFASFIFCECGATFLQTIIKKNRTDLYKCSASCGVKSINRPYLIDEIKSLLETNAKLTKDKEVRANFNFKIKLNKATLLKNENRLLLLEKMSQKNYDLYTSEKIKESQFDKALLRYEDEELKLNQMNTKLIETNKAITNSLQNEILHYSDNLEILKNQILPILDKIVIGEKHCTVHMKGFSMMYFYIYRGHELQSYRNHLKKHGSNVAFKPSLKIEGLDEDTQMLLDNYLDLNPY